MTIYCLFKGQELGGHSRGVRGESLSWLAVAGPQALSPQRDEVSPSPPSHSLDGDALVGVGQQCPLPHHMTTTGARR